MTNLYRITIRWQWETFALIISAKDTEDVINKAKEHIKKGRIINVERLERK